MQSVTMEVRTETPRGLNTKYPPLTTNSDQSLRF